MMLEIGTLALFAADVAADLVECDLYTEVSIPAPANATLIHLDMVCDETLAYGLVYIANEQTALWSSDALSPLYVCS